VNVDDPLRWFFNAISLVRPKLGPLVIQLPPRFSIGMGRKLLEGFVDALPSGYRYAIEFRHGSWFNDTVYEELRKLEVAMVWSEVMYTEPPPVLTTDFVYLRFIGDRSLKKLGWVQINRTPEMKKWLAHLRAAEDKVNRAYVFFNNHFAGYGPACVDTFRGLAGLPPVDFKAIHAPGAGQKRIVDF